MPAKKKAPAKPSSSKADIKQFLDTMSSSKFENCAISKSSACFAITDLNNRIDRLDLRKNRNKKEVFKSLDKLQNHDKCTYCREVDWLHVDLGNRWYKHKLNGI